MGDRFWLGEASWPVRRESYFAPPGTWWKLGEMLTSLDVHRFRGFERFSVDGLARVNLLLGRNNAGKTGLMEAAELLLARGTPGALVRGPVRRGDWGTQGGPSIRSLVSLRYLFHGYQLRPGASFEIQGENRAKLRVHCELRAGSAEEEGQLSLEPERSAPVAPGPTEDEPPLDLLVTVNGERPYGISLRRGGVLSEPRFARDDDGPPVNFVDTRDPEFRLTALWDRIVLTPKEQDVIEAIRLVDPTIERIASLSSSSSRPQMVVKRAGVAEPFPLGTMGDGTKRLLVLSVNLTNAANGFLLVDEIDTGLHHSVLAPMWRLVLATARRLDVQVFASTHSLDCLKGLSAALAREPEYSGDISVQRVVSGRDRAVRYSADELQLAMDQDMELR